MDSIIDTIKHLRKDVYNTEEFKEEFSKQLSDKIHALDVTFVAEQYGGWSVNTIIDQSKKAEAQSTNYYKPISEALFESIHFIDNNCNCSELNNKNELVNVMVSGTDSLVIKI